MSQKDGGKAIIVPVELPMKRKRGRPRKGEGSPPSQAENLHTPPPNPPPSAQANQQKNTQQPDEKLPSSSTAGGNKEVAGSDSSGSLVGQVVHGVIDADFGDGYMLSVVVGGINMKGIALKAGRVAPVTAANDVAPFAKMIPRRGTPFPNIGPQAQVESEAPAVNAPKDTAAQKVTRTGGTEAQPVTKEDLALVQKPDEDMKEAEEDLNSGSTSESPRDLGPGDEAEAEDTETKSAQGDETQAVDPELKSSAPEPLHAEGKELDVELEQAPEQRSLSPKSPKPEAIVEAVEEVAEDSKSKLNDIATDEVKADPEADQAPAPEEPKKVASPEKQADTSAGPKHDSFDEMTLTLGLNQPFSSSEVQNKPADPAPKKCGPVRDGGFNLNIGTGQTPPTSPTNPGLLMSLGQDLGLAGHSVDDGPTDTLPKDNVKSIPSRDDKSAVAGRPADADGGHGKVAEGSIAP